MQLKLASIHVSTSSPLCSVTRIEGECLEKKGWRGREGGRCENGRRVLAIGRRLTAITRLLTVSTHPPPPCMHRAHAHAIPEDCSFLHSCCVFPSSCLLFGPPLRLYGPYLTEGHPFWYLKKKKRRRVWSRCYRKSLVITDGQRNRNWRAVVCNNNSRGCWPIVMSMTSHH